MFGKIKGNDVPKYGDALNSQINQSNHQGKLSPNVESGSILTKYASDSLYFCKRECVSAS